MHIIQTFIKRFSWITSIGAIVFVFSVSSIIPVHASNTPTLSLTNNGASSVGIGVSGADPFASVLLYYPNYSTNPAYTSIDIGQTDSNGSFNLSVGSNSYGLVGGASVYVTIDGASSVHASWPTTAGPQTQTGTLSLTQQSATLLIGQSVNIFPMNYQNTLTLQGNSNPSVAAAFIQASNNSLVVNALGIGSSTVSVCASNTGSQAGCGSVSISVLRPTQTISFSLPQAYLVMGQTPQSISIYGPSSGLSVSNSNRDAISASINGTNLVLQALATGQGTLTVCAPGWLCGTLVVNALSSGSPVPYQIPTPAPSSSNFSQKPELSSLSISSNSVLNSFFGAGSTVTIVFSINQTVTNVDVKIAGAEAPVSQGTNGTYSVSYRATGNDAMPLPVAISYTNLGNLLTRSPNTQLLCILNQLGVK